MDSTPNAKDHGPISQRENLKSKTLVLARSGT